ncbi:MAG TPA: type II toxin-antitoxin system Phd/YefM family antitoxin [Acidimicrobiales bacterium]|nr:type II toxin-antitoxin system Phd/YefM family antitoxin [Acidimicrobiales bacterium]
MVVNIHQAKTHFSRYVDAAAAGEDIVIAKAGRPVARLVPYVERGPARHPGRWAGRMTIADDFDSTPAWLVDAFEGA